MTVASIRSPEIDAALDRLHEALDRLEVLFSSAADRAELDALRRSALRLGAAPTLSVPSQERLIRHFEPARFQRLLELAGPDNGAELLARLSEDLITTQAKSTAAFQTLDWPELRGASHVLISLAGSVGAVSLQDLAERMNLAAHSKDSAGLAAVMPDTLSELSALIAIVAVTQPLGGRTS